MASIRNNKITWDYSDWISCLHPNYSAAAGDVPVPRGNQLTFASSMNPYRNFGALSPGFNPTDVTGVSAVTDSAIRHLVVGYNTSATTGYFGFGINSNAKFFQVDSTTGEVTNAGIWPRTVLSASGTVEGSDSCAYSARISSSRANRIFYSFNNTGATVGNPLWNVGVYDLAGNFDDDFMTTAPATPLSNLSAGGDAITYPHPLVVGDDDVLYMGDGNKVHAYDGADTSDADGKFFDSVLVLPDTFRVTAFAKYQQRLVVFGYKELNKNASAGVGSFFATEAKAYFWDYLSQDPYDSVNMNDNYCTGAFEYNGTIGCFTQGRKPVPGSNQFSKLMLFNGTTFDPLAMFDDNIPIYGGVQVVGDTVMFNAQGKIYQYGSPYPGFPIGLNKVTAGSGTSSGALCTLSTTLQVASTGAATSGGLQKLTANYTTGAVSGALVEPEFTEGKRGQVKSVTVTFAKTSTGGRSVSVSLVGNSTSTTTIISTVSTIDSTNIRQKFEVDTSGVPLPAFDDIKPIVQWASGSGATDAPLIETIEVEYYELNLEGT